MAPGTEGCWTTYVPSGEKMFIYDASVKYQETGVPLLIIAARNMAPDHRATGRRRACFCWACAWCCRKFRAHSSLEPGRHGRAPLQFIEGQNRESLGLTGFESNSIEGIPEAVETSGKTKARLPRRTTARRKSSRRLCGSIRAGIGILPKRGILPYVLRQLAAR